MTALPCAAVLFDTDGTLVDSTPVVERAARAWAPRYGIDPEEYLAGAHGRRTSDRVADFLPPNGSPRPPRSSTRWRPPTPAGSSRCRASRTCCCPWTASRGRS
ncbi:hypothetical protein ACFQHO_36860 [Actinomadura yumaensis]|uniref:hypothetical protein n=1 Tax=Actinomadura TaxID=1988 RepID=UPI001F4F9A4A|nr:hypothetical protein [Actinomadura sp. J1-007]